MTRFLSVPESWCAVSYCVLRNVAGWTRIAIVARKNIEPHEELTYDYQVGCLPSRRARCFRRLFLRSQWLFSCSFSRKSALDVTVALSPAVVS
jgi:hypothetical protein